MGSTAGSGTGGRSGTPRVNLRGEAAMLLACIRDEMSRFIDDLWVCRSRRPPPGGSSR